MSTGHSHPDHGENTYLSTITLDRLLKNPDVKAEMYGLKKIDRSFDLPYLGGYSEDGGTIYIDRHFPEELTYEDDGHKRKFNPTPHIVDHETFEKALIDVLGWDYWHSHHAANAYERRGVLKAGLFWLPYNKVLTPFEKADEHEKLVKIPKDLDLTPYKAPPVDHKLLAHLEAAMGKGKKDKKSVDYEPIAKMAKHQCKGCEHFVKPNSCALVKGYISPGAWCKLWSKK
jgi:hypothetical protein